MTIYLDTEKVFFIKKDNLYMVLHIPSNHTDYFIDKETATAYANYINNK